MTSSTTSSWRPRTPDPRGTPCIIRVAITGSVPTKANNPAVRITVGERIESAHEAFEAGAAIRHAHVRNNDEMPSSDPEKFARVKEELERHCPGMIIRFSTGGCSGTGKERGGMPPLRPDMAARWHRFPRRAPFSDLRRGPGLGPEARTRKDER